MKRFLILTASISLLFAGNLFAQEEPEKPAEEKPAEPARPAKAGKADRKAFGELGRVLRTKDTDKDSKLSKAELGDDTLFDTLDKDKDGLLTVQELGADKDAVIASVEKQAAEAVKEEFAILDRDESSKLSKTELGEEFGGLLEKGDTDKDGELNLEEFTAARKTASTSKEDKPAKGADILAKMDKDGDGKISKDEAGEKLKENFDTLDADKDGFLSTEELKAARGKMAGEDKKPAEEEKKEEMPEEEGEESMD
jgi:Ca2+-binding EF-hand superfamily protein